MDLEHAQKETRSLQSELFKLKNATEESVDNLEIIRRENKNLNEEVAELQDQLSQGAKNIHDLEKEKRIAENSRSA